MKNANLFIIFFLSLFFSHQVLAWGDIGHKVVGEIAERNLSKNGKDFVTSILAEESLSYAAIYPDHVRSDSRFDDFSNYHFIEIPTPINIEKQFKTLKRANKDSQTIIENAAKVLLGEYSIEQKRIYFRYLVHVIGDVHQPLHVGNGLDRGANDCFIRIQSGADIITKNLHSVWDNYVVDNLELEFFKLNPQKKYFGYKELTELILADNSLLKNTSIEQQKNLFLTDSLLWFQDSRLLHQMVYPDSKQVSADQRLYCKKDLKDQTSKSNNTLPLLDNAYFEKSAPIVKLQLLKAGMRLANFINELASKDNKKFNSLPLEKLLKEIQFENH